ncbi:DUF3152 domain-containing protein [Streptomyces sp. NBC_00091]|uniref:DUF3152 domain-containing protein n=1 Tax=Streptomyces sp. NBC_00091 TaxID=2975648 RepID=UPI002259C983|nr:DUF3152 domain-containing protein [Streptomyces sp. NBC_00091]MCX5376592.1 DUF3152 domain-containing protein [Streptomyces sp. NBC_00091]
MRTGRSVSARRAERRRRLRRTVLWAAVLAALSVAAFRMGPEEGGPAADGRGGGPPPPPERATAVAVGFTASSVAGRAQGRGRALRWRVEAENGSGVDPDAAARAVEAILGDRRGWIRNPEYGFRLAGRGEPVDFTVKVATPATTDRLCEVVTPELIGEANCRVGHTVVVNLKRWQEGSPRFSGPLAEYRALIVNHEVGHELGHEHEGCPRPGAPAPAMMQQIKGLQGCTSNAWPYDRDGTYLAGPRVP